MREAVACLAVLCLLGCDAGSSSKPESAGGAGAAIDPADTGDDRDDGAGSLGPTPVETYGQLAVFDGKVVDQSGQSVELPGVSSMWLNWEDDGYAEDATALAWMRNNWGLRVIRASMGIEPEGAYLGDPDKAREQVERIVDNAILAGVYVIVDWHDHHAQEHQAQAIEFFTALSTKYGDTPNLIYEPYNEPLNVDWNTTLKPYHEAVVSAIRAHDPDNLIVLGTPNWSQDVDKAASAPVEGENLLYTLHFYSCSHTSWLRAKGDNAIAQGLALFVTEWGASDADGGTNGKLCLDDAARWHEWLNERRIGWTAWKLDGCAADSTCLLAAGAPLAGGWTNTWLHGHAPFVRARMQQVE